MFALNNKACKTAHDTLICADGMCQRTVIAAQEKTHYDITIMTEYNLCHMN